MEKLNQAVERIKAGKKGEGKQLLVEIIRENPNHELAWLYLAAIIDDPEKKIECLNKVLQINPNNQQALRMLNPEPESDDEYRSFRELVQVWMNFFGMTEAFLATEAKQSNNSDTLMSVVVYTIVTVMFSMISGFTQLNNIPPELMTELSSAGINIFQNSGLILLVVLVCSVIFSPIAFYLGVGIQYLGARIFGGIGEYRTQTYLQAIIIVPLTILGGLTSLASSIPYIGVGFGLAGLVVSIFGFIMNIRAIKVVHDLSTGRAIGSMIIPPFVLMIFIVCLSLGIGSVVGN